MADEKKELRFRYLFSPDDERAAFAACESKRRRRAAAGAVSHLLICVALVWSLWWGRSRLDLVLALAILAYLTLSLADFFRFASDLFFGARSQKHFTPFEILTVFGDVDVTNEAQHYQNRAQWPAVEAITIKTYGIAVRTVGARWFIPRSAFASEIEMHKAYKEIKTLYHSKLKKAS